MSENRRKISFSDTPRIRSFSNCDPVHLDVILPQGHHGLSEHHRHRLSDCTPAHRRYSEICKPNLSHLNIPSTHYEVAHSQNSPRQSVDSERRRASHGSMGSTGKKEKTSKTVTVDRYITSIVQQCSNEALATPLDPPPKGSEVYEQVLEEFKDK